MDLPSPAERRPVALHPEIVAPLLLLVFLLREIAPDLSPIWILLALHLALYPFRHRKWVGPALAAATGLLVVWAIGRLNLVLAPFVVALILAYVLDPVVGAMGKLRLSRVAAAALLLLAVVVASAVTAAFVIPPAIRGLGTLAEGATELGKRLGEGIRPWLDRLPAGWARRAVEETLPQLGGWLQHLGGAVIQGASSFGRGVGAAAQIVAFLVVTPVLLFYLLVDMPRIRARCIDLVPHRHRDAVQAFLAELDAMLASYLRGQLIVSAIVGGLTGALLGVAGISSALTLGIVTGLLNLVPVAGFWVSLGIALLVTVLQGPPAWPAVLWVVLIYLGVQQLEGNLISPRIVGREVGLHPVFILFGLVFFGSLFGFVGVLAAVPLTAVCRMVVSRLVRIYRASRFFQTGSGAAK